MKQVVKVLSIAGSDSSAGAGIQADIKTIAACGGYAATVITALTAQNTQGVYAVLPVSLEMIKAQFYAVIKDFNLDAIKIGMLLNGDIIDIIVEVLSQMKKRPPIVLDPVMVSTSGDLLLEKEAIKVLQNKLIPLSTVITPNILEANILLDKDTTEIQDMKANSILLSKKFGVNTYLKGGHINNDSHCLDVLCLHEAMETISIVTPRINTKNTHGTGCSLSSALACFLAQDYSIKDAFKRTNTYIHNAIIGGKGYHWNGHGPIHHFIDSV